MLFCRDNAITRGGVSVVVACVICSVVAGSFAMLDANFVAASPIIDDPTQITGPDSCAECHESEHEVWMASAHQAGSKALARDPEARRIAKALGVRRIKTDDRCISCHYTPQQQDDKKLKIIAGVSCESCHNPASNWIDSHARFGADASSAEDETPEHRADRHEYCDSMGMNRPGRLYELASSCFKCHGIYDDELVGTAGHPKGDAFEFASWSQGEIRHNFVRAGTDQNPASDAERVRVMYVLGASLRLEYACRAVAAGAGVESITSTIAPLLAISDTTGLEEAQELAIIGESVVDAQSAAQAVSAVQRIGARIAEHRLGAMAVELDALIPAPRSKQER